MSARHWQAASGRFAPTPEGKRQAPFVEPEATRGLRAFDDETIAWLLRQGFKLPKGDK